MSSGLKHALTVIVAYAVLFISGMALLGSAVFALEWLGRLLGVWR
jgi:hypothetical protein